MIEIEMLEGMAPAQADELPTFTLTFKPNGTFEPATLEVPAGRFKIELINESNEPVEFESIPLRKEKVLAPGVTSSLVFRPLDAGRYRFFDDFHQTTGQGAIVAK